MRQGRYVATLKESEKIAGGRYYTLCLSLNTNDEKTPKPGQFVQLKSDSPNVLLRRPISIARYDSEKKEILLLIQQVGKATRHWMDLEKGSLFDMLGPLGKSFTTELSFVGNRPLLVAGGVGIAPIFMLASELSSKGIVPTILSGASSADLIIYKQELSDKGTFFCTTEDGSLGESGFVTDHTLWNKNDFTSIFSCGPLPMMQAVAKKAKSLGIPCEVSLENKMACGIGACLCCVESTQYGNLCTCTEGPVFNIDKLRWE